MSKISFVIPCYNEEENIECMYKAISDLFEGDLKRHSFELIFIDNDSTDKTRQILRDICKKDKNVKAIFNAKNFGQFNSPFYGMLQATGDCIITIVCDFQDPIDLIPQYIAEWENGYKIVIGIKTSSKESKLLYLCRSIYYKFIKEFSDTEQIEHFTGSGLYDREFIEVLRKLDDPTPFLRGIVAELGFKRKEIPYIQPKRERGKSKNNVSTLYDAAMLSITSYTKVGIRLSTVAGMIVGGCSFIIGIIYLVMKLFNWDQFDAGNAPLMIAMFFIGAIQLFFIGILGEYILNINKRIMKRPLVIEDERINF